jgi:hypothetical protein
VAFDQHDVAPHSAVAPDAFAGADLAESRARLAVFSGKMPDWRVQIPVASVESINAASRARGMGRREVDVRGSVRRLRYLGYARPCERSRSVLSGVQPTSPVA